MTTPQALLSASLLWHRIRELVTYQVPKQVL